MSSDRELDLVIASYQRSLSDCRILLQEKESIESTLLQERNKGLQLEANLIQMADALKAERAERHNARATAEKEIFDLRADVDKLRAELEGYKNNLATQEAIALELTKERELQISTMSALEKRSRADCLRINLLESFHYSGQLVNLQLRQQMRVATAETKNVRGRVEELATTLADTQLRFQEAETSRSDYRKLLASALNQNNELDITLAMVSSEHVQLKEEVSNLLLYVAEKDLSLQRSQETIEMMTVDRIILEAELLGRRELDKEEARRKQSLKGYARALAHLRRAADIHLAKE